MIFLVSFVKTSFNNLMITIIKITIFKLTIAFPLTILLSEAPNNFEMMLDRYVIDMKSL